MGHTLVVLSSFITLAALTPGATRATTRGGTFTFSQINRPVRPHTGKPHSTF